MKSRCTVQYKLTDLKKKKNFQTSEQQICSLYFTHTLYNVYQIKNSFMYLVLCGTVFPQLFIFFLIWFYYYFTSHNTKFLLIAHK